MLIRKRPSDESKTRDETTVLDHLVHSELVEKELGGNGGFARLAQLIQQAGAHNVSHTLGTIVGYLLLNPSKLEPLREELAGVWVNRGEKVSAEPDWLELEKAPYLSAVVYEGLRCVKDPRSQQINNNALTKKMCRMAIGGMNRAPRVFPDDAIECCGWTVPKGVSDLAIRLIQPLHSIIADHPSSIDSDIDVHLLDAQRRQSLPKPRCLRPITVDHRRA